MPIHYQVVGEGYPIVMLHGWTLDHQAMFHALEPIFEKCNSWKRIYIDLPGMGRSVPQESIQNSDDMLGAVLELMDQIIPNQPFVVCGYSYGGLMARGIAHLRRGSVRGMLLFAPVIIADPTQREVPEHQALWRDPVLLPKLSPEDADEFELSMVVQGEREWQRFRDEILIPSKRANSSFLDRVRENGYGLSFDIDQNPVRFEHPVLIIAGRQDDVVGFKDVWRLLDKYPHATFAVLDIAGHNLQIERPGLFEALVHDWLDRLESSVSKEESPIPTTEFR